MCWFLRRGENRSTRRKTLGARKRTNKKTQPTYDTGPGVEPGHSGGRRALSPLGHPCSLNKCVLGKRRNIFGYFLKICFQILGNLEKFQKIIGNVQMTFRQSNHLLNPPTHPEI